jgi:hypothetical protein
MSKEDKQKKGQKAQEMEVYSVKNRTTYTVSADEFKAGERAYEDNQNPEQSINGLRRVKLGAPSAAIGASPTYALLKPGDLHRSKQSSRASTSSTASSTQAQRRSASKTSEDSAKQSLLSEQQHHNSSSSTSTSTTGTGYGSMVASQSQKMVTVYTLNGEQYQIPQTDLDQAMKEGYQHQIFGNVPPGSAVILLCNPKEVDHKQNRFLLVRQNQTTPHISASPTYANHGDRGSSMITQHGSTSSSTSTTTTTHSSKEGGEGEKVGPNPYCERAKIVGDGLLLGIAAWSEVGYAIFSAATAGAAFTYAISRFSGPEALTPEVTNGLKIATNIGGFSDAFLSIFTSIYMTQCRKSIAQGISNGLDGIRRGDINALFFYLNLAALNVSFFTGSFGPWAGLAEDSVYGDEIVKYFGASMFLGQFIIYNTFNVNKIFGASTAFSQWLKSDDKTAFLRNIFSKRGGFLLLRSIVSVVSRAWSFKGLAEDTLKYVFKSENPTFNMSYEVLAGFLAGYQTLVTQVKNDYDKTFAITAPPTGVAEEKKNEGICSKFANVFVTRAEVNGVLCEVKGAKKVGYWAFMSAICVLALLVFFQRWLGFPPLFSGPQDNPQTDLNGSTLAFFLLGAVLGPFGAAQYADYALTESRGTAQSLFFSPVVASANNSAVAGSASSAASDSHQIAIADGDERKDGDNGSKQPVVANGSATSNGYQAVTEEDGDDAAPDQRSRCCIL